MSTPLRIFWQPAGMDLDALGDKRLVDVTDGDTPNIRVPIRMLNIDTPEKAGNPSSQDANLVQLAQWMTAGRAPIDDDLAAQLQPRLATGDAGTRQEAQGEAASQALKDLVVQRLAKPDGRQRSLFVRVSNRPFDDNGRLLAYVAPSYTPAERERLTRAERATFNLLMVESGWAAPFVLYPNIPNELDLPLLRDAAREAIRKEAGAWADPQGLLGYEYRMLVRLFQITRRLERGEQLGGRERFAWIGRYCADMETGLLYRPQQYLQVAPENRLFLWPADVQAAVGQLNLVPA